MRISSKLFLLAAVLSIAGAVAHEVLGAPKVLKPLMESNLPADVIWLHHYSWHVGTIAVLTMAALFVAASRTGSNWFLAFFATVMSAGFAILGIGLALLGDSILWSTPAPYPWTLVTILGVVGIATHPRKT